MSGFVPLENIDRQEKDVVSLSGFTLAEVMVTVFIFSLIFTAVFMILSGGRASWYTGDAQMTVDEEVRRPLLTIDRELRQTRASEISGVPADNNFYANITFNVPFDRDGDGSVIDSLGNIEWSDNINYALNGNKQIVRSTASGTSILANNISSLQFRRLSGSPNVIQIYITALKTAVSGRILQSNIMSSIKIRN